MPALRTSIAATGGLLLCLLCACNSGFKDISRRLARPDPASQAPQEEVRDRRRTYYDRAATRPHTETGWLLRGDGRSVKDGIERAWYENGQLEFERSWTRDEPSGLWRTWFEDGTPRFEHRYDAEQPTPMTWWHPTGTISSTGTARFGVREGPWSGCHPDGSPAFEGFFSAGRRSGFWTFWYPDGSVEASGEYLRGDRVGVWENYAQGMRELEVIELPVEAAEGGTQQGRQ